MTLSLEFIHLTAFSTHIAGGNPAAVVFLTPEQDAIVSDATRQAIGANWAQPMTALVVPRPPSAASKSDEERHATLCAASAIFNDPRLSSPTVTTLQFHAKNGRITARKTDDGLVEIELAAGKHQPLVGDDPRAVALKAALTRAFGPDVPIKFMAAGLEHLDVYCLAEVETDDLRGLKVKISELVDSPFIAHMITTSSKNPSVAFESRMFAPAAMIPEDPVCGTGHTLITPYWGAKSGIMEQLAGEGIRTVQVSSRGGELKVRLDEQNGLIRLAGPVTVISKGKLFV
ncbi:unnamed protein product [Peniophora sp. CBMAI 1063]|nr:unnamed protein product [Peniophora sp. CBMAI 1063]